MINIGKLKKIKNNFPVLVAEKAIPKNICKNLTSEISASRAFDDMIMGGRSRINKGSKTFLKKWGFVPTFFVKHYLRGGKFTNNIIPF